MSAAVLTPSTIGQLEILRSVQAKIAELEDIAATLRADIEAAIGTAEAAVSPDGEILARYTPVRKFDPSKAVSMLTAEQVQACNRSVFDAAAAKKLLTARQVDECMAETGTRRFTLA